MTEAPGRAVRTPDSLLRGSVSTALTLTSLPSKRPAGIVEILRFFFVVQRRCACDVSTMDTHTPSCRARSLLAPWTTSLPRGPLRASVSDIMTPTCLRSEETGGCPEPTNLRRPSRV